jgi:hypothetical protein
MLMFENGCEECPATPTVAIVRELQSRLEISPK